MKRKHLLLTLTMSLGLILALGWTLSLASTPTAHAAGIVYNGGNKNLLGSYKVYIDGVAVSLEFFNTHWRLN